MHTRLTIPERLKDLRVAEKRMSLQELSEATGIPSSTLVNYEKDENVDMSLGNLLTLADFHSIQKFLSVLYEQKNWQHLNINFAAVFGTLPLLNCYLPLECESPNCAR